MNAVDSFYAEVDDWIAFIGSDSRVYFSKGSSIETDYYIILDSESISYLELIELKCKSICSDGIASLTILLEDGKMVFILPNEFTSSMCDLSIYETTFEMLKNMRIEYMHCHENICMLYSNNQFHIFNICSDDDVCSCIIHSAINCSKRFTCISSLLFIEESDKVKMFIFNTNFDMYQLYTNSKVKDRKTKKYSSKDITYKTLILNVNFNNIEYLYVDYLNTIYIIQKDGNMMLYTQKRSSVVNKMFLYISNLHAIKSIVCLNDKLYLLDYDNNLIILLLHYYNNFEKYSLKIDKIEVYDQNVLLFVKDGGIKVHGSLSISNLPELPENLNKILKIHTSKYLIYLTNDNFVKCLVKVNNKLDVVENPFLDSLNTEIQLKHVFGSYI